MRGSSVGILGNPALGVVAAAVALSGALVLVMRHGAEPWALLGLAGGVLAGAALSSAVTRWTERRIGDGDEAARAAATIAREFVEHATDWFWETDSEHRYVKGPLFGGGLHRPPFDEVAGLTRERIADPEDVRANPEKWRRHREDLDNRRPFKGFEYRVRRPDGSYGWIRASGWPVHSPDGRFLGYRGTATDIDELKSQIVALAESEARFELAAAAARLGIWRWYPESGRFVIAPNLRKLLGYRRRELRAGRDTWLRMVHPEDRACVERAMTQAAKRGAGASFEVTCRLMHKSGDIRWGQLRGHLPELDDGSEPHMIGAVVDITERAVARQALVEGERRMATLLANLPGMAYRCRNDADWTMEFVSEGSTALTGHAPADLIANARVSFGRDVVHPDDQQRIADEVQQAIARDQPFALSYRIVTADRAEKWVWEQGRTVHRTDDGVAILEGFITDVTEARCAELELNAKARRLLLAEEVAGIGHWQLYLATDQVVWSDQTYRIHGVSPETFELTLDSALAFYPPEDAEVVRRHLAEAVAQKCGFEFELHIRRADGELRDVHSVGRCHTDESGQVDHVFGVFRDITEIKARDREAREGALRLKAVVETATDGVVMIDSAGTMLMANPACERLFGYAPEEMIGRNVNMLMPSPFREEHDRYLETYRRTGKAKVIGMGREVVALRKDGATFPADLSVGEMKRDGGSIFIGFLHDLTAHKAAAAQLVQAQKMEAVGQLAGGIAHDFNNILTVISGNLDLATRVADRPEKLAGFIDRADQAADRAAELTKRLLAFSRKQVLEPRTLDVNKAVIGMRALIQTTVGDSVEVTATLTDRPWPTSIDPHQLETALLNLSVNARDAMPDGGQLILETRNVAVDETYARMEGIRAGDYVLLSVTDTGEGMPPEVAARAFEPFFTTKESGKGTGLGLSMVFGFVKQSRGHVKVYSEQGRGTTIKMYLPRHRAPDEAGWAAPDVAPSKDRGEVPRGSETVLVVDDDEPVRAVIVEMLSGLGYRVCEAGRGEEALAALAADSGVDLLFTDVAMPGKMNGLDLAERATRLHPQLKVVLASGYAAEAVDRLGRKDPAFGWISKPFDRARLGRTLKEMLDRDRNGFEA